MGLAQSYIMLLMARVVGAIISSAAIPTARAIVADLSGPEKRSQAMGMMGAAMGTGMAMGPMLGGVLAPYGLYLPFFAGAGMGAVTLVLATWLIREPDREDATDRAQHVSSSLAGNVRLALRSRAAPYLWLSFTYMFGHTTLFTVLVYLLVDRFDTQGIMTGAAFTVMGLTGACVQGLLIGRLTARFGDFRTIIGGLFLGITGHLLIGGLPWLFGIYAAVVIVAMSSAIIQPMTLSLVSIASPLPHGVTMGLQGTFRQTGMMLGPLWAGWTYAVHPTLPFLSAAALLTLTTCYLFATRRGTADVSEAASG